MGNAMIPMSRTGWRRLTTCLALGAILCQTLLATLAIPATAALADISGSSITRNTIVICTGSGMKRIALGPDGEPVEQLDQDVTLRACHACALAGFFALNPPAPLCFLLPASGTSRIALPLLDFDSGGRGYILPESRAPPIFL